MSWRVMSIYDGDDDRTGVPAEHIWEDDVFDFIRKNNLRYQVLVDRQDLFIRVWAGGYGSTQIWYRIS